MKLKQFKRLRECQRKQAYKSQESASMALVGAVVRLGPKKSAGMHTYKCPHCGKWHIGHGQGL